MKNLYHHRLSSNRTPFPRIVDIARHLHDLEGFLVSLGVAVSLDQLMLFLDKSTFTFLVLFSGITERTRTRAFVSNLAIDNAGHKRFFSGKASPFEKSMEEKTTDSEKIACRNSDVVTRISSTTTDSDNGRDIDEARLLGTLVLLTVPLSWGTYVPVGEWFRALRWNACNLNYRTTLTI